MNSPLALDLFCGAGGAAMGLIRAGFDVTGVDINPQPRYPARFVQGDALAFPLDGFDFIWASPPCQAFCAYKRRGNGVGDGYPNLIAATRGHLQSTRSMWVIENVGGAPLHHPFTLCGSMFGLDIRRHRFFESNFAVITPVCLHDLQAPRFPHATNRSNPRSTVEVGVWRIPMEVQCDAMGIDWMARDELSQAIPPAYSEWIGKRAMRAIAKEAA